MEKSMHFGGVRFGLKCQLYQMSAIKSWATYLKFRFSLKKKEIPIHYLPHWVVLGSTGNM